MQINFHKNPNGLVPAIIQDHLTNQVLMLGFMNQESFNITQETKKVCFFSRTKNALWTKGETSGNYLLVQKILLDCDNDSLLIKVKPLGPTCHTGADTCWNEKNISIDFLYQLQQVIADRKINPIENSYINSLYNKGINKIAQKLGEEAVELVIEALGNDKNLFLNESADLLFHFLILLEEKNVHLQEVIQILKNRHKP